MATYIMLLSLTPEGRRNMIANPDSLLSAGQDIDLPETQVMGLYGVLGDYDFVSIVAAPDNESAARFSMELGARAGVHVTTMPAIPIGRLEEALGRNDPSFEETGATTPGDEVFRAGH